MDNTESISVVVCAPTPMSVEQARHQVDEALEYLLCVLADSDQPVMLQDALTSLSDLGGFGLELLRNFDEETRLYIYGAWARLDALSFTAYGVHVSELMWVPEVIAVATAMETELRTVG